MRDGQILADQRPLASRPEPANKLSPAERTADQGRYLASEASFYRILRAEGQQQHRGRARPPIRRKPPTSYKASAPCEVWTWE